MTHNTPQMLASADSDSATPTMALDTALAEIAALRAKLATLEKRRARLYKRLHRIANLEHRALAPSHSGPFDRCRFLGCSEAAWSLRMGGPLRG